MSRAETGKGNETLSGADILVKSLVDHDVEVIFAYPGGASMPLHQALTRYAENLRTILPRHEQGGAFAAQGYARSTGRPGVVMATSGPGATNLVTAIADAVPRIQQAAGGDGLARLADLTSPCGCCAILPFTRCSISVRC